MQLRLNGSYDILEEDIKKLELQKAVSISAHSSDVYALSHLAQALPRPSVGDKRTHDIMINSSYGTLCHIKFPLSVRTYQLHAGSSNHLAIGISYRKRNVE